MKNRQCQSQSRVRSKRVVREARKKRSRKTSKTRQKKTPRAKLSFAAACINHKIKDTKSKNKSQKKIACKPGEH